MAVIAARVRADLTQEAAGLKADINRTYLSGIERETRNPTVRTLRRIAEASGAQRSLLLAAAEGRA